MDPRKVSLDNCNKSLLNSVAIQAFDNKFLDGAACSLFAVILFHQCYILNGEEDTVQISTFNLINSLRFSWVMSISHECQREMFSAKQSNIDWLRRLLFPSWNAVNSILGACWLYYSDLPLSLATENRNIFQSEIIPSRLAFIEPWTCPTWKCTIISTFQSLFLLFVSKALVLFKDLVGAITDLP